MIAASDHAALRETLSSDLQRVRRVGQGLFGMLFQVDREAFAR